MVKLTRIYTRGGDRGETSLGDCRRVPKHQLRVAAYGTVDEANATLGLARLHTADRPEIDAMLGRIQTDALCFFSCDACGFDLCFACCCAAVSPPPSSSAPSSSPSPSLSAPAGPRAGATAGAEAVATAARENGSSQARLLT